MGANTFKCEEALQSKHSNPYMSLKQLQEDLKSYLNQNKVGFYSLRERRIIQQLYTFQQKHLSDTIIQLQRAKENFQKDFLVNQIDHIDLQVFDQLTFMLRLKNKIKQGQTLEINSQKQKDQIKEQFVSENIIQNSSLKKVPQNQIYGLQILQKTNLIVLVPIQCFSGIGALRSQTKLKSRDSLLKIFVSKIQAINHKYKCSIPVIFLVNCEFIQKFQNQFNQIKLERTSAFLQANQEREQLSTISNYSSLWTDDFNHYVISYKSPWPLMNEKGKIFLNQNKQINFNSISGDLIQFIQKNSLIQKFLKSHKILQIANINNLLQCLCDVSIMGYLAKQESIDIIAKVVNFNDLSTSSKMIQINQKGFVQFKVFKSNNQVQKPQNQNAYKQNNSLNIESYYIKTEFIVTRSQPMNRLMIERMKVDHLMSKLQKQQQKCFFVRDIQDLLHFSYTKLINVNEQQQLSYAKVDKKLFCSEMLYKKYESRVQNGKIGYYRYCKKIILQEENIDDNQIVDIDPKILYGDSKFINILCNKLAKLQSFGFPLVITLDSLNN